MEHYSDDPARSRHVPAPEPFLLHEPRAQASAQGYVSYASFWRRFFAATIDGLLLSISTALVLPRLVEAVSRATAGPDPGEILIAEFVFNYALYVVISWLYFAGFESSSREATLGKQMFGIVVTDLERERISFGRASARFFAHFLSDITFLIGYLIQPFTAKRQALHDLAAGTLVLRA